MGQFARYALRFTFSCISLFPHILYTRLFCYYKNTIPRFLDLQFPPFEELVDLPPASP